MVKGFEEIRKEDIETVGGKGANLGEMTAAGIPIPSGFVLTSQAYREFLKENHISDFESPQNVRKEIVEGILPETVTKPLLSEYGKMGNKRVAVRSSATAEDLADASFAGQQETYLNVRGEEELLQKVKECYASLWGERAVAYRRRQGYEDGAAALAVVIQEMVESDAAGVLFTVNPSEQKEDEIQINASYGLGESVVSGKVTPDEYICDRSGNVIKSIIESKETEIVYDLHGTREIQVDEERRSARVLSGAECKGLTEIALRIEEHYKTPMDIEWAVKDGKIYILQARAITTLHNAASDEEVTIGSVNRRVKNLMTFMLEKNPFAYYPLDYDLSMILGVKKEELLSEIGIDMDMEMNIDENGVMYLPTGKIRLNRRIFGIRKTLSEWLDCKQNETDGNTHLKENQKILRSLQKERVEQYSLKECGEIFGRLYAVMKDNAYARFRYGVFPSMLVGRKIERALKKVDAKYSSYDLLGDLDYKTVQMNRGMEELAKKIFTNKALTEDLLKGEGYQMIMNKYPEIKADMEKFLAENGHKSDFNCYCLAAKSWNEDKDRFLKVLRPVVLALKEGERLDHEAESREKYHLLLESLENVTGSSKMQKLKPLIQFYRFSHRYREDTQYLWETAFEECRNVYRRVKTLLGDTLEKEDDLMYLFYEELMGVCQVECLSEELREKIRVRRTHRPIAEKTWEKSKLMVLKTGGDVLRGIGSSGGEAIGKVCVVTSPDEFYKLQRGDVLVCKYTDPEWTPLFTLASAVVSDMGGSLSHAAIVAREYGIPAVLGTGNATSSLKDGDRVCVDGKNGEVRKA